MSDSPLISIIVVTLNAEKTIKETITSLESQTYKDFEVIFKDGGSKDKTIEIIKSSNLNFTLLEEKDSGIYNAMNQAASSSNGKYLSFLNADDIFASDKILASVIEIINSNNCDLIFGPIKIIKERNKDYVERVWKAKNLNKINLILGYIPPHPGSFIKKKIFKEMDGFNESFNLAGDFDFFLKCINRKVHYVLLNSTTVLMADGGASYGFGSTLKIKYQEIIRSFKQNKLLFLGSIHIIFRTFSRLKNIIGSKIKRHVR